MIPTVLMVLNFFFVSFSHFQKVFLQKKLNMNYMAREMFVNNYMFPKKEYFISFFYLMYFKYRCVNKWIFLFCLNLAISNKRIMRKHRMCVCVCVCVFWDSQLEDTVLYLN